jgi:hypothetical protein
MAGANFTTSSQPIGNKVLSGGLNSTSGPLNVQENESSDLLNIDFNKFGSILKRNGYASLGTAGTNYIDGLSWYEFSSGAGSTTRMAIAVAGSKFYKMDALDGTFDDVTGAAATITSRFHCDFENYLNKVYVTTGTDTPFFYAGTGTTGVMAVPTGVIRPKFIRQFNNYLFIGNLAIGATDMPSRIYWSAIKDPTTWASADFIDVSKDDGQVITGLKVLGDRLVIYKERSIYNLFFTGDADIPFVLPGGGKSNSTVGCIAPNSIQEIENGHVFLSYDGLYYYDGNNSYKISDRISASLGVDNSTNATYIFDKTKLSQAVSCLQRSKNRYFLALPQTQPTSSSTNNGVIVWDYFNNAFSVYDGMAPSSMATFYVDGLDERPYFGDYNGFVYRMDTGSDDYPKGVQTAIDAYYYTNWKNFDDLCDQKGIAHVYIYYALNNAVLTFSYNYDFEEGDLYNITFDTSSNSPLWGTAIWGAFNWGETGGGRVIRRDLTGRGRVVRFKISNNILSQTFRVDGIGSFVHAETNV